MKYLSGGVVLAAAMALLAAPAQRPFLQKEVAPMQSVGNGLQITIPTLYPAFDPNISDYAIPYNSQSPVQISVNAPKNTKVAVDGEAFRKLAFTTQVDNLKPGQSFSFVVNTPESSKTYYVRCLPTDFPTWTTERPGIPQAAYYIFAPSLSFTAAPQRYVILTDNNGIPLWWYQTASTPQDVKLLPNGNIAWTTLPVGQERKLDGTLVHTFAPDNQIGGDLDLHELQQLPNGDYVYIAAVNRGPVDLSAFGGSPNATVSDQVIEEFAPNGSLVWSWSAMEHIPVSETGSQWKAPYLTTASPADPWHMNAVEADGNGFVVSCRHTNAIIRIDKATGNIVWKLGGSTRPESLTFVGDPYGNFSGQHDSRILPDGTLTLHDNGTLTFLAGGRPPRAVRYAIDTVAKTATFVEQVTDQAAAGSGCCGSARKMPGGNWVMEWGANPFVTEIAPDGTRVFRLTFPMPYFSYRAVPVLPGELSREALRSGMDSQFPR